MRDEDNMIAFDLSQFRECIQTWIPSDREGYRLYLNEGMNSGPSDQYILTKYSWQNESGDIVAMGHTELTPADLEQDTLNETLEEAGYTALTDAQYKTVYDAYQEFASVVMRDIIIDGLPQLYQNCLFYESKDFGEGMRHHIDKIQDKLEKAKEYDEDPDQKNYYEEYLDYGRLGDDQYHNIEVIPEGFDWNVDADIPFLDHCDLACTLNFTQYEDWEVRAIEYLHNSVLVNKPELAKTRALMEYDYSQKQIAEKLGKSPSTVSRQVAQIDDWFSRASWTENQ